MPRNPKLSSTRNRLQPLSICPESGGAWHNELMRRSRLQRSLKTARRETGAFAFAAQH